ncbi:ABC transporter permease [Hymenobacter sp. BT507]|uniref:ABC transporter permease n=1 Tax=Hymenobacter citatus TaxID=2763506 RepID=A0ABR7MFW6_9BACT|nr:ABC transporter permease [Hymenobacter citatus]MBC6609493.1 ABC transporter permease [Hymenobacter citatus]
MWNRRRANALLIVEMFLAFVVLFAVGSIGTTLWRNYRQPLGFTYTDVWQLNFTTGQQPRAEQFGTLQQLLARLRSTPGVEEVALSASNTPFSFNDSRSSIEMKDEKGKTKRSINNVNVYNVGPELPKVLGLKVVAGRWFDRSDVASGANPPVVIDERMQRAMYPDGESAVGKMFPFDKKEQRIIGVVSAYRTDGELQEPLSSVLWQILPTDTIFLPQSILLKVRPGSGAALEKQLADDVRRIGPGWSSTIKPLAEMHQSQMKQLLTRPILLGSMSFFLLLNVALGLFGVLWLNISRRRGEIGVRRAMGATAGNISRQVLGEILVLTTFGLGLGLLVAAQFPLLGVFSVQTSVYLTAMVLAAGLLYLLATVCALYPSRLAAGIQPAVALREE